MATSVPSAVPGTTADSHVGALVSSVVATAIRQPAVSVQLPSARASSRAGSAVMVFFRIFAACSAAARFAECGSLSSDCRAASPGAPTFFCSGHVSTLAALATKPATTIQTSSIFFIHCLLREKTRPLTPAMCNTCCLGCQPLALAYNPARIHCTMIGPSSTMNTDGKMKQVSGNNILTGASLASFSARWKRRVRISSD